MSILSVEFFLLAAGTLIVYFLLPLKIRWIALLCGSAAFICLSGWYSAAHLTAAALVMWGGGLLLQKHQSRLLLAGLLTLNLGTMAFLKYYPVFTGADLILPAGLSYFTFQSAGYLTDVYRGKAEPQRNPLRAWLFIGYFPQLPQGPISTWKELGGQLLTGHRLEPENIVSGFQLLLWGLFKKMVIADRLASSTAAVLQGGEMPGWLILSGAALYAIRLYLDFSGGMDVVRGLSRMAGIELPENFRRPFFSRSVAEYWRRWHITLGAWFRSYLLYPLTTSHAGIALGKAASRLFGKKTGRTVPTALATLIVFLLIGIWHAANWNAVLFGAYFGIVMAASTLLEQFWKFLQKRLRLSKGGWMTPVRLVRTWILILTAQYFAFTPDPSAAFSLLGGTFRNWDFSGFAERMTGIMTAQEWIIAGAAGILVLAVDLLCERKKDVCGTLARTHFWIRWPVLLLLILAIATFGIYGAGYDPAAFLYTQF